jgi:putative membrane protein
MLRMNKHLSVALAMGAVIALGACGRTNDDMSSTDSTAVTTDTSRLDTTTAGGTTAPTMTDANIIAMVDADNAGDSAVAVMASKKATSKDVRDYAKMMIKDHHAAREELQALIKATNIQPQQAAHDSSGHEMRSTVDSLTSAPKGMEFDKMYIRQMVDMHTTVLDELTKALNMAQDPQLKALLQKQMPVVQQHLDRAKEIQTKLDQSAT